MAYFADDLARDKLMVLFFLNEFRMELTRAQLTTVAGETELIPYFELQSAVIELEEGGYVAAVPRSFGQAYSVTAKGKETLAMFSESLPDSMRHELSIYAASCRDKLRKETQYSTSSEKLLSGGFQVTLKILERDGALLSLQVVLPDADSARAMCAAWPDKAQGVYQQLFSDLLS